MPWEKKFDEAEALEKATQAFWANGYDGTSMTDLLGCMGIKQGSFYATFGSKEEVYCAALDKYAEVFFTQLEQMKEAEQPLAALGEHINWLAEHSQGDDGPKGCMVANAAVELAQKNETVRLFVQRTLKRHRSIYEQTLAAAKSKCELPGNFDARGVADTLVALVIGMRVLARAGMPRAMVQSIRDQALNLIQHISEK